MPNRSIIWVIWISTSETIVDANYLLCIFTSLLVLLLAVAADDTFSILLLKEMAANHTIHMYPFMSCAISLSTMTHNPFLVSYCQYQFGKL